ncbi:hypothetical protein [Hoeflea sp. TYP-13]|uniref:hypothetical protein n=1 Tax=Hoeflea sp. TYP-13 TaxID=3230023 RepID=UPI0034C649B2
MQPVIALILSALSYLRQGLIKLASVFVVPAGDTSLAAATANMVTAAGLMPLDGTVPSRQSLPWPQIDAATQNA